VALCRMLLEYYSVFHISRLRLTTLVLNRLSDDILHSPCKNMLGSTFEYRVNTHQEHGCPQRGSHLTLVRFAQFACKENDIGVRYGH
jgi:hypothetical protein